MWGVHCIWEKIDHVITGSQYSAYLDHDVKHSQDDKQPDQHGRGIGRHHNPTTQQGNHAAHKVIKDVGMVHSAEVTREPIQDTAGWGRVEECHGCPQNAVEHLIM